MWNSVLRDIIWGTKTRPFVSYRGMQLERRDGFKSDGRRCFTGDTNLMGKRGNPREGSFYWSMWSDLGREVGF